MDGQRKGEAPSFAPSGGAFGRGEAAEPGAGAIDADFGDAAEEHPRGEGQGEGVDLHGVLVADAADFEVGEPEPAGGGDRGGVAGKKKDPPQG
ncbi:MAG: hypothetical protein EBT95_09450 [Verrucomicrobia bacterium]|nr:hypothetical protein [Verrucomicrobiota bacterium]